MKRKRILCSCILELDYFSLFFLLLHLSVLHLLKTISETFKITIPTLSRVEMLYHTYIYIH